MSEIHILDNNLINKIAAGEVVERPASVVKELVENSIDAGAKSISIDISGGGIDFIKITDDGKGIPKNQVKTAFFRHATSKISDFDDLQNIMTLGFRGEALSSISSVSKVEIVTKTEYDDVATKVKISAGEFLSQEETASLSGTAITVKNLFFNTPARRKFLKKPSTESGYINDIISRIALGHPGISFKYINNKSVVIQTSGDNNIKTCVFHIYGKDVSSKTISVNSQKNDYILSGLIGMPQISRANRSYENFFINNRFIKSKIVSDAIEDAYRGKLMGGRFPLFVLNLSVPPNTVDVNVHPTKLEARFSDEDFIYQFIYDTVYSALKNEVLIPEVIIKEKSSDKKIFSEKISEEFSDKNFEKISYKDENKITFSKNKDELAQILKSELLDIEDVTSNNKNFNNKVSNNKSSNNKSSNNKSSNNKNSNNKNSNFYYGFNYDSLINSKKNKDAIVAEKDILDNQYNYNKNIKPKNNNTIEISLEDDIQKRNSFFNDYKIVGQIFKTYWIIEQNDSIYMIDQHAAHEKIIFEELMEKFKSKSVLSQRLIQPVAIDLSEKQKAVLEDNYNLIENFGFEIEEFGKNTYAVKSVPYIFKNPENAILFTDILDILVEKHFDNIYDAKVDAIAQIACKAAVKGNNKLDYTEAEALIKRVISLENPFNCPHGRPTIIKMTNYDIEKFFKRVT